MSDPEQNRLTACKRFFVSKKTCGVPFIPPHGFVFLSVRAVAFGESNRAETRHIPSGTNALIARSGRVRISANAVRQHSRANRISGVYVRPLQPTCLCFALQGLPERRGCCPHPAR